MTTIELRCPICKTPHQELPDGLMGVFCDCPDDAELDEAYAADPRRRYSVAVYQEDMAYGGPEEGGWWYDAGELTDYPVRYFRGEEAAYRHARRLNHWLHRLINRHRREYSSVISDGRLVAEVHANHPPGHYPAQRPHYE
jgi:hypothetical protein